jgi:hypothetical protein
VLAVVAMTGCSAAPARVSTTAHGPATSITSPRLASQPGAPAASAIVRFHGGWQVHDGYLCLGQALRLRARGMPSCAGSADVGWMSGWLSCYPWPPARVPVCEGYAALALRTGPGETILATVTQVACTGMSGKVIRGYRQAGSLQPGDTFSLGQVAPGQLKTTYLGTHLDKLDVKYGNPYWCRPGLSSAVARRCGA